MIHAHQTHIDSEFVHLLQLDAVVASLIHAHFFADLSTTHLIAQTDERVDGAPQQHNLALLSDVNHLHGLTATQQRLLVLALQVGRVEVQLLLRVVDGERGHIQVEHLGATILAHSLHLDLTHPTRIITHHYVLHHFALLCWLLRGCRIEQQPNVTLLIVGEFEFDAQSCRQRNTVHLDLLLIALMTLQYARQLVVGVLDELLGWGLHLALHLSEYLILEAHRETVLDGVGWLQVQDGLIRATLSAPHQCEALAAMLEFDRSIRQLKNLLQIDQLGVGATILLETKRHDSLRAIEGHIDGPLWFHAQHQLIEFELAALLKQSQLHHLVGLVVDHDFGRNEQQLTRVLGHHLHVQREHLWAALQRHLSTPNGVHVHPADLLELIERVMHDELDQSLILDRGGVLQEHLLDIGINLVVG